MLVSARRPSLRLGHAVLALAATAVFGAGCAPTEESVSDDANIGAAAPDGLGIPMSGSPSGSRDFTFCSSPRFDAALHLKNAAWLAMLSANEYAHLGYFAPQLLDLGFGNPRGADDLWGQCGKDLGRVRDFEIANQATLETAKGGGPEGLVAYVRKPEIANPENFGVCARDFLEHVYNGRDGDGDLALPAAAFKDYLIHQTDDTNWIQFFSAKPYTFVEKLVGKGSTQAVIARHGKRPIVIVSFRGTERDKDRLTASSLVDLLTDATGFRVDLHEQHQGFGEGWGKAHKGFLQALQSIDDFSGERKSLLTTKLRQLTKPTKPGEKVGVYVTGHSLGAAVATLFAARLLDEMDDDIAAGRESIDFRGLYTFGSPRVGNETFASKLAERALAHRVQLVRFRNDNDVVTSLAPSLGFLQVYVPAGRLVLLRDEQNPLSLPDSEPGYTMPKSLDDHDAVGASAGRKSGYYSRIKGQIERGIPAGLDDCVSP